jgi:hypothetical protein
LGTQTEIVAGETSGGASTSHSILTGRLGALLDTVAADAAQAEYERAAIDENVIGSRTIGSRKRTFRYLKELYLLRPDSILFRGLRDLWSSDPPARPLLAGVCALARDSAFRASSSVILASVPNQTVSASDLALAVAETFPGHYSMATQAKIGRNTFSSWEQTGHLRKAGRIKIRVRPACFPANVAYALLLGHLQGRRGPSLFETLWARVLDQPKSHLYDLTFAAAQRGFLQFRHAGGLVEVSFPELLRPFAQRSA